MPNHSIYIHIPFCKSKCHYCGFYSIPSADSNTVSRYINALCSEITNANIRPNTIIDTIFFGGGTPTFLHTNALSKIMDCIHRHFAISDDAEISIEANPATNIGANNIDFAELRNIGFNRISIGVQSFNDNELEWLGRLHNSQIAIETIQQAKQHFASVSIDLIYAVPEQSIASLRHSLALALQLEVQHISAYSLSYDTGTLLSAKLGSDEITAVDSDTDADMYALVCETLATAGYQHYEVSNYAKQNFECRHNLNYWLRNNYYGFGAAAHSCIDNVRYENTHDLQAYCKCMENGESAVINSEVLSSEQVYEEQIFLGLRSVGVPLSLLAEEQLQVVEMCIGSGYGVIDCGEFVLTDKGRIITDEIVLKLLDASALLRI
ncbi:MAG: radical SAM family heme chaperone HemW [Ignavibacteria bacterium]|jgi:oxygen-independent coproporphyrinogen-3 oxidase|nr:radical SAM family heme chaperone HemW [Ignavibacteria bacterium]